jgi:hypothetical protein
MPDKEACYSQECSPLTCKSYKQQPLQTYNPKKQVRSIVQFVVTFNNARRIFGAANIPLTDPITLHLSGYMNWHNVTICGDRQPPAVTEATGSSTAFNIFPAENTVNGVTYLDMLGEIVLPILGRKKRQIEGNSNKTECPGICTL